MEPASSDPDLHLDFALAGSSTTYADLTPQLSRMDLARFHLTTGSGPARDTSVVGGFHDGRFTARLVLRPEEARVWVQVDAELFDRDSDFPFFRGQALLEGFHVSPAAEIELEPAAFSIQFSTVPVITSLADTIDLAPLVSAVFPTGETIVGAEISLVSRGPSRAEIVSGSRLVPRGNGLVYVEGSALGASDRHGVAVWQTPVSLTGVAPADTTIARNESFQLRPFGQDPSGAPLLPGAHVTWSGGGTVVNVDQWGVAHASQAGTTTVQATIGGVAFSAQITVTP